MTRDVFRDPPPQDGARVILEVIELTRHTTSSSWIGSFSEESALDTQAFSPVILTREPLFNVLQ